MTIPTLEHMAAALLACPSISSVNPNLDQSNQGIVALLHDWLGDLGFQLQALPIPGAPGKFNLVARLGTGSNGLVLAGHTDTVPYDEGRWRYDPFGLTEADRRWYGLGTSDMKCFFAIVIAAIAEMGPLSGLARPLTILATADEESSMAGARALLESPMPLGRHALIGEPTGLRPVRTHKGITMERIRLIGRSGHSSDPSLGRSALEGMYLIIAELLRWRDELQAAHRHPLFRVPMPTLNLGHIHGGDNPNRICGECELLIDLRPLPGMDLSELRAEMNRRLSLCILGRGLELEISSLFGGVPPMETPAGAEIIRVAEALTGHPAETTAFATEGPFFNQLGMDTLILGPGDIDQAHQPDEYLAVERLRPTMDLIQALIRRFCLARP